MEDGFNSGWRNIGIFALWSIPYILGAAACIWLGFFMAARRFFNQLSQEQRRAVYVGAEHPPKSKLEIETPNTGDIKIDRVDLDGSTASVYFTYKGTTKAWDIYIHWQLISPNGTLMGSGESHSDMVGGPGELQPGESGEVVLSGFDAISLDKRAKSIRFWVEHY